MKDGPRAAIEQALRTAMVQENFLAWLDAQPPRTEYDYKEPCACAIALYLQALGFSRVSVRPGAAGAQGFDGRAVVALDDLDNYVIRKPRTLGALAKRLRACSTTEVPAAHNGLVGGSTPPGPTT